MNTPSLEDLRIFSVLVKTESVSAAAAELEVSAAYISKRLKQLESKLGVRLVHRTKRKLILTGVGSTLSEWGQRVLDSTEDLMDAIHLDKIVPKGMLRVCSSSGFGRNFVGPALSKLAKMYPDLEIQLDLLDRKIDLIHEGFHLDVRLGHIDEPDLVSKKLAKNHRILCASPSYLADHGTPTQLSDLMRHRCLVIHERDQQHGRWILEGEGEKHSLKLKGVLSSNNGETVKQWTVDGHGISLRSTWDINPMIRAGQLVRILPQYFQGADVYAIYSSKLSSSAKLRICVDFLAKELSSCSD